MASRHLWGLVCILHGVFLGMASNLGKGHEVIVSQASLSATTSRAPIRHISRTEISE